MSTWKVNFGFQKLMEEGCQLCCFVAMQCMSYWHDDNTHNDFTYSGNTYNT